MMTIMMIIIIIIVIEEDILSMMQNPTFYLSSFTKIVMMEILQLCSKVSEEKPVFISKL